jgi:trk system potassium uptake protein TrkA
VERFAQTFTDSQVADCTNERVLQSLGVHHFDICFVCMGSDFQSSLMITDMLKEMKAKYVVAKASHAIQADLLERIGADEVVYPEKEMAESLAVRYHVKNIFDYIELTDAYGIFEIGVPTSWIGRTIEEIDVRRQYKVNIIAVKLDDELKVLPGADYCFKEADHIMVLGMAVDVDKISR